MKTLLAAAVALSAPAFAVSNDCEGTLHADYIDVPDVLQTQRRSACKFDPKSAIGKRILKVCMIGEHCTVELNDNINADKITRGVLAVYSDER